MQPPPSEDLISFIEFLAYQRMIGIKETFCLLYELSFIPREKNISQDEVTCP